MIPKEYVHVKHFNEKPWLLLFYQNISKEEDFITEYSEFLFVDEREKFSIFQYVYQHKNEFKTNGFYEFLLEYPSLSGYNEWMQGIFPLDANESNSDKTVEFQEDGSHTSWYDFHGLICSSNTNTSFLDGSVGDTGWWYTIGAKTYYTIPLVFPGPDTEGEGGYKIQTVFLWIHILQKLLPMLFMFTCNLKNSFFSKIQLFMIFLLN